ncbi:MAG: hypothetical protein AB1668_06175 [Nanoarchaeota archaeon]
MESKKRSVLVVVLILFLIVFVSTFVVAKSPAEAPLQQYQMIRLSDWPDCGEAHAVAEEINLYCTAITDCYLGACDGDKGKDSTEVPLSWPPQQKGCYMNVVDTDTSSANDCGWALVHPGLNIDENPKQILWGDGDNPTGVLGWVTSDPYDPFCLARDTGLVYKGGQGVICLEDRLWYQCDAGHVDTPVWVGNNMFVCSQTNPGDPFYAWKDVGADKDRDGYGDKQECDDDSANDPAGITCSTFSDVFENVNDYTTLSLEDIRAEINKACKYPQHSKCALCINPAAPEVCGDKVNNDCGGSEDADEMEEVNELEGETYDDCNKNQYSCEQMEVPVFLN